MKLLVATRNSGKVRELADMLGDLQLEWLSLDDVGSSLEIAETGETFEDNAVLKANGYATETGLLTLADDSGLEVDALHGRPGVHTARYGGPGLTPEQRYIRLLDEMEGFSVGAPGFEPGTSYTPCKRASRAAPRPDLSRRYYSPFLLFWQHSNNDRIQVNFLKDGVCMSNMIQVTIDSVRVSLMSPQRVIVLRQLNEDRYLPIWVGPYEDEAISVALQEIEMARPLTHDLLKNVITLFGAKILRIEIIALRENIFFGHIVTEQNGEIIKIDSRPSDAIAMAVRAHVPILIDPSVMDSAGIFPEENIEDEPQADEANASQSDERLSIFEDFFDQLEDDDNKPDESPKSDIDSDPDTTT